MLECKSRVVIIAISRNVPFCTMVVTFCLKKVPLQPVSWFLLDETGCSGTFSRQNYTICSIYMVSSTLLAFRQPKRHLIYICVYSKFWFDFQGIIGELETSNRSCLKVTLPGHDGVSNGGSKRTPAATYNFKMDDILQYFFGKAYYSSSKNTGSVSDDKKTPTGQNRGENNESCKYLITSTCYRLFVYTQPSSIANATFWLATQPSSILW